MAPGAAKLNKLVSPTGDTVRNSPSEPPELRSANAPACFRYQCGSRASKRKVCTWAARPGLSRASSSCTFGFRERRQPGTPCGSNLWLEARAASPDWLCR